MTEIARLLSLLSAAAGAPAVLATVVQVEGSSYRRPGARRLMLADGTSAGSVSGGCLEEDITERARRVLASGDPELAVYDTAAENDLVWGTGLGCQGIVRVLLERIPAVRPAWIDTLNPEALRLYQRLGYEIFGELKDYPVGGSRFFLQKKLKPDG